MYKDEAGISAKKKIVSACVRTTGSSALTDLMMNTSESKAKNTKISENEAIY